MILEDLEREILKVAGQGGIARVPEETVLESMEADDEDERRAEMEAWMAGMCEEYHLKHDQDKDMFGQIELLFFTARIFTGMAKSKG